MFRSHIRDAVAKAAAAAGFEALKFSVGASDNPEHGDYSTNAALILGKAAKKNPVEVAERIAERLRGATFARVTVAPPGFVNVVVSDTALASGLAAVLEQRERWGAGDSGKGKTAIVEYFQLNIAKRPHIGHLRSAVIGDALKRMLAASGYRAVSDTHVGDWGTQFGILLLGYKEREAKQGLQGEGDPLVALEQIYIEASASVAAEPARLERAKREFAKLEVGDPENRSIWQWMVDVSMQKLEESAKRLGLLPFDEHRGESSYEGEMPAIAELALLKGVAKRLADGAVTVDLSRDGLDEAVLLKSDGASTYLLRDLATIKYRKERWGFWRNIYVVDVRQSHHFRQLFRVAELLGFEGVGESAHVEFGFMSSPEGALSTRKGTAISLDAVLDEAKARARKVIEEKNPELKDKEIVAEAVGLGALKYFDLSHHRRSDIVFQWNEALAFDGNTGPYLQYTHARLKSILRRFEELNISGDRLNYSTHYGGAIPDTMEHQLLVGMLRLPEVIEDALGDFAPNVLANYLYHLAKLANEFYHSHPVMQEPDEAKRGLRLAIVAGVAATLKNGLGLLGIAAPEEM